jgi:hypothetical protein
LQVVHCEFVALVHVTPETHWLTSLHFTHAEPSALRK